MLMREGGRMMGCGKSRPSPPSSEVDVSHASHNAGHNHKVQKNNKTSSHGNRKSVVNSENSRNVDKKDGGGKGSPFKKSPGERGPKSRLDRNDDIGVPANSPKKKTAASEKANGSVHAGRPYTLEVPSELPPKIESSSRTTKDFKTLTSSKTVHVTNSQIEFFKMLDEKIEQGAENFTSGNTSEMSSTDDVHRH